MPWQDNTTLHVSYTLCAFDSLVGCRSRTRPASVKPIMYDVCVTIALFVQIGDGNDYINTCEALQIATLVRAMCCYKMNPIDSYVTFTCMVAPSIHIIHDIKVHVTSARHSITHQIMNILATSIDVY